MVRYDTYVPIGHDCTPAYYLRLYGLRTEAYPLDWMVFGSDALIHLFQTGFSDFFVDVTEEEFPESSTHRRVRDVANGVVSLHHFPKDREVSEVLEVFRGKMRHRFARLHTRLLRSRSVMMLGFGQDAEAQVRDTLVRFARLYPHLSIHLIYAYDAPDMDPTELCRERHDLNDQLALTYCRFDYNQREHGLWGNESLWRRTLADYCA